MRRDADGVCVFVGIVDDDVGLNGIRKVFYLAAALGTDDRCCSDSHSAALAKFEFPFQWNKSILSEFAIGYIQDTPKCVSAHTHMRKI